MAVSNDFSSRTVEPGVMSSFANKPSCLVYRFSGVVPLEIRVVLSIGSSDALTSSLGAISASSSLRKSRHSFEKRSGSWWFQGYRSRRTLCPDTLLHPHPQQTLLHVQSETVSVSTKSSRDLRISVLSEKPFSRERYTQMHCGDTHNLTSIQSVYRDWIS